MYEPKKESKKNLEKLFNKINWEEEYDKRFINEQKKIKNKKYKDGIDIPLRIKKEYIENMLYLFNNHIEKGGTEFGFKLYLIENNYLFECKCCKNERHTSDIEILFYKNEIIINLCKDCQSGKFTSIENKIINFRTKQRRKTDHIFKFKNNIRSLISGSFKRKKNSLWNKKYTTEQILGCTLDEFRCYIENKFTKDMHLNNYGKWHLDHIKPLIMAKTEEDVIKLNHYTNFQPLWAKDNLIKSGKY